jgi:hypothetical protein
VQSWDRARETDETLGAQDLTAGGGATQPPGHVQRGTAKATLGRYRLTGVQTHAHAQGEGGPARAGERNWRCSSTAALSACRADPNTHNASSPRNSSSSPSNSGIVVRTNSANLAARCEAASSP